jgi:hypothetical protein
VTNTPETGVDVSLFLLKGLVLAAFFCSGEDGGTNVSGQGEKERLVEQLHSLMRCVEEDILLLLLDQLRDYL